MLPGQDVLQAIITLLTPNNPILLTFLAAGLVYCLELIPGEEI